MDLLTRFIAYIKSQQLFTPNEPVIIAVSGGLDSVAMSHLFAEAKLSFAIAHCHFGLRGTESDRDAHFVEELAEQLQVPFFINHFDTSQFAASNKLSIQVAARELRYQWFEELLKTKHTYHWIATAHHRDDYVETALMQFCKGTGISGLKGIASKRGKIIRPLLFANKEELLSFAQERSLHWVEDSSNGETKYTRNFFRHEVLPLIEKQIHEVKTNVGDTVNRLKEAEILYQQALEVHKKKLLEYKDAEVHIPVLKLQKTSPLYTILFEIIRHYNFTPLQTGEVIKLLNAETGRSIASSSHRILRNRKWLIISPLAADRQTHILIEQGDRKVQIGETRLQIKTLPFIQTEITTDPAIAYLDARQITYPFILRRHKAGDYFYPLGMKKKKKLARFFIDQKLSTIDKEKVWVIESDKRIVWVVGLRIDDRFKIVPSTVEVVQITWSNPVPAGTSSHR